MVDDFQKQQQQRKKQLSGLKFIFVQKISGLSAIKSNSRDALLALSWPVCCRAECSSELNTDACFHKGKQASSWLKDNWLSGSYSQEWGYLPLLSTKFPRRGLLSHAAVPKGDPCGWIRTQSQGIFIIHIFCFSPRRRNYQNGKQLWIKWEIIGEWVEISQNKRRQIFKQKWATGTAGLCSGAHIFCFLPFFGGWNESKWQNSKAECHYSVLYLFSSCHQLQESVNSDYVFQAITKLAQQGFSSSFYHLWEELFTEVTMTQHSSHQSWMESLPTTDFRAAELSQETQVLGTMLNSE